MRVEPTDGVYDENYRPHLFALRSGDSRYPFAIECSLKMDPLSRMFSVVLVTRRGRKQTTSVEIDSLKPGVMLKCVEGQTQTSISHRRMLPPPY